MARFCFTGAATIHGAHIVRENLMKLARDHGHDIATGPSRGVDYLVTDNASSGSRKAKMAAQCGTKVITPLQFVDMCGGQVPLRAKDLL